MKGSSINKFEMGKMMEANTKMQAEYGVIAMLLYYGIMTASKALGMDSANELYYVMFGIACLLLLYKYFTTEYTLREIALDILLLAMGCACFIISGDMTVLLLAITVIGLKNCDFRDMIKIAVIIRLSITGIMIIASFLGLFDQGETAQTTTSFQDITVYNFGYSTANNAYINIFLMIALLLYLNYEKINWIYAAATSVLAFLMYTFTNSRTGTMLFAAMWVLIFCEKFLLKKKARYVLFKIISLFPLICAVFSFAATSLFNPDGGYWSKYINRIFSGRLNITHRYHEALSVSLLPRAKNVMDSYRGFGFIDNAYMSVYFHDGLIVALVLIIILYITGRRLFHAGSYRELVFIAVFAVYAMMEEFPLNPVVNPFIMLTALVVYPQFRIAGQTIAGKELYEKQKMQRIRLAKEDSRQNVLLVHNFYRIPGGEDTVFANEKRLLEEYGHRVQVYTRTNMELDGFGTLKKLMLPFTSVFSIKTYREVKKIIEQQDIDIVHVHNTLSLISPSVYYAAFRCHVPVVQTMHNFRLLCPGGSFYRMNADDRQGMVCEECISRGLGCAVKHACYRNSRVQTIVSASILWIYRMLGTYRRINFICLTEFNRSRLLELNRGRRCYVSPGRIYVKPNFTYGLSNSDGSTKVQAQSAQDNGKSDEYYVFAGRLENLKGIKLLVEAFAKMPLKRIKVLGDGPLKDEIMEYCRENGCNNIELLGRRTGREYNSIVNGAKAIIVTSQCYETFGMGIAEAFSCGVPAIAGDIGNIGALVTEGVTGLHFTYNSPEALIDAVNRYEGMDIAKLRENAAAYYSSRFTKESNYAALKAIYDDVCGMDN